jgi:diguanylate cyclase (GGDEF)-like protein
MYSQSEDKQAEKSGTPIVILGSFSDNIISKPIREDISMFYLGLENQIHLFMVIVFSSYIYLSSLSIKHDMPLAKHFGTAFFIPLVLCLLSFLSISTEHSHSYLFFSEFLLITSLILIIVVKKNSDPVNMLMFLLYSLPVAMIVLNLNFVSLYRSFIFDIIISLYICTVVIFIISFFLLKRYSSFSLYGGVVLVCISLLIPRLASSDSAITISLIAKAAGYILFSVFFYRSTVFKLEESHSLTTAQLEKINQSVQREVERRVEQIEQEKQKLAEMEKTDELSGAYTKKAIRGKIRNMIERNPNGEFSVLMFDIDNFKIINNVHGRIIGDKCIRNLVNIAGSTLRSDDKLGRYIADRFIVLLPGASPVNAYLVAERLRKNVEKTTSPHYKISIGIASFPHDASNARDLINSSEKALHSSKKKGRNTVTHYSQTTD